MCTFHKGKVRNVILYVLNKIISFLHISVCGLLDVVQGLSMAQYRAGSSDAPQSPVSPLSQPSSSYSPSQSPGTSASMASSPQMVDVTYQPDISTSQLQQQQSYTNITSQLGQQQLTRLVQKPLMQPGVENLPQKFQQIKVRLQFVLSAFLVF